jgi:hypothetical protein
MSRFFSMLLIFWLLPSRQLGQPHTLIWKIMILLCTYKIGGKNIVVPFHALAILNGLTWPIWTLKTQVMANRRAGNQIDFWPLKVENFPNFLHVGGVRHTIQKALDKGYNFALNLTSIIGLHTKLQASKVVKVPILGISRLPLWSLRTKWHLGANLVARHKEYYKGESGDFPQVQVVVNLVSPCLFVARPCTEPVWAMH